MDSGFEVLPHSRSCNFRPVLGMTSSLGQIQDTSCRDVVRLRHSRRTEAETTTTFLFSFEHLQLLATAPGAHPPISKHNTERSTREADEISSAPHSSTSIIIYASFLIFTLRLLRLHSSASIQFSLHLQIRRLNTLSGPSVVKYLYI